VVFFVNVFFWVGGFRVIILFFVDKITALLFMLLWCCLCVWWVLYSLLSGWRIYYMCGKVSDKAV